MQFNAFIKINEKSAAFFLPSAWLHHFPLNNEKWESFPISHFPLHMDSCFFFSLSAFVLAWESSGAWWSDPRDYDPGDGWTVRPPEIPKGKCPFCRFNTKQADSVLFTHIRDYHTNMGYRYQCRDGCDFGTSKWGNWERHWPKCNIFQTQLDTPPSSESDSSSDSSSD